ncbi:MAG: peptidase [Solirubrobacterales bacterium]|nr:peptidase [Solirubrobacterales bacterium]
MDRDGVDALVATTPENVYYLSDYGNQHTFHFGPWGLSAAILPRDADIPPTLIVADWELPHISERPSWMPGLEVQTGISTFIPDDGALSESEARLAEMWRRGEETGLPNRSRLVGRTLSRLGLDSATLVFDDPRVMLELQARELERAEVIEGVNFFREARMVKTPDELAMLTVAARKNQAALQSTAAMVAEGVTTGQLLNHYLAAMSSQGGYGSHMTGGGHERTWHTYPDPNYRLKSGDIYNMDPAGHYRYYWADMGRAAEVGGPTGKFEHLYGTLQEVTDAVLPMMRPGVSTGEIKAETLRLAAGAMPSGLVPLIHSIGIEQYDHPQSVGEFLSEDFVLEADMVINYEIPYFEFPWGVLQLEDTYHVTPSGPRRLVDLPQEPFYSS